jgi:peptide/nickel transport system substrate-binding protein
MRKVFIPLTILLVCAFVITGCSSQSTPSPASAAPAASSVNTSAAPAASAAVSKPTTTSATANASSTANVAPSPTGQGAPPISSVTSNASAKYGGTIKWIEPTAPGQPLGIPWLTNQVNSSMQLCLEPLFREQIDGTLVPALALSYKLDPKEPSITFQLRKGVKFHDGTDFNAQSLKWNLDMLKKEGVFTSQRYYSSINVVDDYTLKIVLTQWRSSLMPAFAANMIYQISPTAYQKLGADGVRWNMVGTGPFKQVDFNRDVSLKGAKFADYWNTGTPYVDSVQYIFVADEMTREALYKSGTADILNCARSGRVAAEFQALGQKVLSQPAQTSVLIPDSANADSAWSNIKVRQAAEYAIDKAAMANAFGYGFNQAAYQLPNPKSSAYVSTIQARKYDVARAKQLLTEAGYPNGFKTRIIAQAATANHDVIVALQAYLGKIGIQADLEFVEQAKYTEYTGNTWKNALIYASIGQSANFNQMMGNVFASPRSSYKSNANPPNWDTIYNTATTDINVSAKTQQDCVQALSDDVTIIPINYEADEWVVSDKLMDSGIGTRGAGSYWNPEYAWWNK